jgi:hypothetical protein
VANWLASSYHLVVVGILNNRGAGHLHDAAARPLGLADEVAIGEVAKEAHAVLDGSLQGMGDAGIPPAGADDGGRDGRASGASGCHQGEHGRGRGAHDGRGGGSSAAAVAAGGGSSGAAAAAAAATTTTTTTAAAAAATTATRAAARVLLAFRLVFLMRKQATRLVD